YPYIEVLVINDGSSEKETALLQTLKEKYSFVLINQANSGLVISRNNGAREARGEFIAFLDADDKVCPDYYEKAIKVLKTYTNVHFVGCWVQFFEDKKDIWPTWNPEPPYVLTHNS